MTTTQQQDKRDKFKRRLITSLLWGVSFVLIVFSIMNFVNSRTYHMKYQNLQSEIDSKRNQNDTLLKANQRPQYVVTAKGHMDYQAKATISRIKSMFNDVNTYRDGAQYNAARKRAQLYVRDKNFFKTFLPPYMDYSGTEPVSQIDALNMKAKNDGTTVYEINPNQYLVITKFYNYHSNRALDHLNAMTPYQKAFYFEGDNSRINTAKELHGLN